MLNDDVQPAQPGVAEAYGKTAFNQSYAHFIERAREKGLDIVIAHFLDYLDNNRVSDGWTFKGGLWQRTGELPIEFAYDKFSPSTTQAIAIKEDLRRCEIPTLNHPDLETKIKDKAKTYNIFPELVPLTQLIPPYSKDKDSRIDLLVKEIEKFRQVVDEQKEPDFDPNIIFLKPQYGHGGKGIIIVEGENYETLEDVETDEHYVIQPFIESSEGIPELGVKSRHDLRIITFNGQSKISYIRVPPPGGYISSIGQGGTIKYLDIADVPKSYIDIMEKIDSKFIDFDPRLYCVDMVRGKSGRVWVFELNGKPGQVWDPHDDIDIQKTKDLQDLIIDSLVQLVNKR